MDNLDRILKDPRVAVVSDERVMGDGVWVTLAKGFCNYGFDPVAAQCGDPSHLIHADSFKEVLVELRSSVRPCTCKDCKGGRS